MRLTSWIVPALFAAAAWGQSPEMKVVNAAAEAMGGKDRVLSIRTLKIYGYGQQAYQNGGGNIVGKFRQGLLQPGPPGPRFHQRLVQPFQRHFRSDSATEPLVLSSIPRTARYACRRTGGSSAPVAMSFDTPAAAARRRAAQDEVLWAEPILRSAAASSVCV